MPDNPASCSLQKLKTRFYRLWDSCLLADGDTDPAGVWLILLLAYNEDGRHYHTADHLCHCLREMDLAADLMQDATAVEVALWFHDIILIPDAADNEERSAGLFRDYAGNSFPPALVDKISDMIRATAHGDLPNDQDTRFLCDIDLSSIGAPWDVFLKDSAAVRAEQVNTNDRDFYLAKTRFFSSLVERPSIFQTDFFRKRYEHTARENIHRFLAQLESQGHA